MLVGGWKKVLTVCLDDLSVLSGSARHAVGASPQANLARAKSCIYHSGGQTFAARPAADRCQVEHVCGVCAIHTRAQRSLTGSCVLSVSKFVGSECCAADQTRATSAVKRANTHTRRRARTTFASGELLRPFRICVGQRLEREFVAGHTIHP
jgi:hypothetical protein